MIKNKIKYKVFLILYISLAFFKILYWVLNKNWLSLIGDLFLFLFIFHEIYAYYKDKPMISIRGDLSENFDSNVTREIFLYIWIFVFMVLFFVNR